MIEYRTTDTDELAPYPNMTAEGLRDFEDWADEIDRRGTRAMWDLAGWVAFLLVVLVVMWAGTS